MNLDLEMLRQTFFEETTDLLGEFESSLLRLEDSDGDKEILDRIFRCAHSIKGGSATFGFTAIAQFTHSLETLLDKLRNGLIKANAELIGLLLESLDQLTALVAVEQGLVADAPDSSALLARIELAIECAEGDPDPDSDETLWRVNIRFYPGAGCLRQGTDPLLLVSKILEGGPSLDTSCDASRLPGLADLDPEACYLGWNLEMLSTWAESRFREIVEFVADENQFEIHAVDAFETSTAEPLGGAGSMSSRSNGDFLGSMGGATEQSEDSAALTAPKKAPRTAAPSASSDNHTLRVSTDKVDKLINLVGELVINQSMLNEVVQDFSMEKLPRLMEAVAEMARGSRELQERVMGIRMLPIKHAFGRFPRLVRDLSAANGKLIDLRTTGEETELDKTVIEAIADPLTHLVRNSVDHGLEPPDERIDSGKPEMGTLALHAFHEGGNIVVEVEDDGRGLNRDRILQKATERGLVAEGEIPSDEAIYNFIFHPGFSTANQVTDLSGRGVGLDIVKQGVQALGGSVTLSSTPGNGTRFRIRLPLTMAILEGLSVSAGGEIYILPLTSIVESIRPKSGDVRLLAGEKEVVLVRGEVLPIIRLCSVFGATALVTDPTQALIVIVENDRRKIALMVDELIGQSQVVIKSLESNYRKVDGIAGATIMGNGRVALILDIAGVIQRSREASEQLTLAA